ncbi:MAG: aldo/keto reductase [Candidatus Helarchaeota archaeon]
MERKVKKIRLTGTDIEVTPIGLGVWQFSGGSGGITGRYWPKILDETMNEIVKIAIAGGINWFDTAEAYGSGASERNLSKALKANSIKDEDVIIADKWWPLFRLSGSIKRTIDRRLHYLDGYSIDIYQIHQPFSFSSTKSQMDAMADLVEKGKIRSVGVSNFSVNKMVRAYDALKERGLQLVSNQVKYNLLNRKIESNGLLDKAKELGIKIIAWSPLEQGVLTGKYHKDPNLRKNVSFIRKRMYAFSSKELERSKPLMDAIEEIASVHEVTPTQVVLNWLINFNEDIVLAIPGASKAHHVEQNVGAMYFKLTKDEMEQIDELSVSYK